MSKLSLQKLYLPNDTICELTKSSNNWAFWIKGSFGVLKQILKANQWKMENNQLYIKEANNTRKLKLNLAKPLIKDLLFAQQMTIAASIGFKNYLRVRGVGFKFNLLTWEYMNIQVGFSHLISSELSNLFDIKQSRKFKVLRIKTLYLERMTLLFSFLRNLSKPSIYTGKGIRYRKELKLLKQGKKSKR